MKRIIIAVVLTAVLLTSCGLFDAVWTGELTSVVPKYASDDQYHEVLLTSVEITERSSGKKFTLSGDDIATVLLNLSGVTCGREKGIAEGAVEKYAVKFTPKSGGATVLYIINEGSYVYSGYTYTALQGKINISYFDLLFGG